METHRLLSSTWVAYPRNSQTQGTDAGAARVRALADYRDLLTLWRDSEQYPRRASTVNDCLRRTMCAPKILTAPA